MAWLAHAYAIGIAGTVIFTVASLVRLRWRGARNVPFKTPGNLRLWGRELPLGLLGPGIIVAGCALTMVLTGRWSVNRDGRSRRASLTSWFLLGVGDAQPVPRPRGTRHVRPAALGRALARPGRGASGQRARAGAQPACARARGRGAPGGRRSRRRRDDGAPARRRCRRTRPRPRARPRQYERQLLSEVVAMAERLGRPVRLLIVPARSVFDAIVATVLRLRSSDVYVGESVDALGGRPGAAPRRSVGARRQARAARRPARHPSPQRPRRLRSISAPTRRRSHPAISI